MFSADGAGRPVECFGDGAQTVVLLEPWSCGLRAGVVGSVGVFWASADLTKFAGVALHF